MPFDSLAHAPLSKRILAKRFIEETRLENRATKRYTLRAGEKDSRSRPSPRSAAFTGLVW